MKLIHTADLHLSSSLSSLKNSKKQSQIMFNTFKRLINYSNDNNINHILISGDLFDTPYPDSNIVNDVLYLIKSNENINFYYLRGNHDNNFEFNDVPNNLKLFSNQFKSYTIDNIKISGIETNDNNDFYSQINLDQNYINILMLHGTFETKSDSNFIDKQQILSKKPNYIALGHLHKTIMSEENNIIINNPGCLEPHGFDELDDNGFIEINIDENTNNITSKFINFAESRFIRSSINIENINSTLEIKDLITRKYSPNKNYYLEITLIGESNLLNNELIQEIQISLENNYEYFKITDNTNPIFNFNDYLDRLDIIGEMIRNIYNSNLNENNKKRMAIETIKLLEGGKIQ